jgi:hypothetical protein
MVAQKKCWTGQAMGSTPLEGMVLEGRTRRDNRNREGKAQQGKDWTDSRKGSKHQMGKAEQAKCWIGQTKGSRHPVGMVLVWKIRVGNRSPEGMEEQPRYWFGWGSRNQEHNATIPPLPIPSRYALHYRRK